ncbi:hypothetical protein WJX84_004305 [Apatococcus fuscideae]|uniref:Subtilisin n=1 Tax=Apatococcus fuscideae TaxID=2026836 RepID=A0AAW1SKZ8_9CHLO
MAGSPGMEQGFNPGKAAIADWGPYMKSLCGEACICQSATAGSVNASTSQVLGDADTRPFWAAGLQGQDQIVSMGDTGMDMNHCFFTDTSVSFPGNQRTDGEGIPYYLSISARKVVYYRGLADFVDAEGHGTHCAGSMIGAQSGSSSYWQGMAPGAYMAFTDIGSGTSGSLGPPTVLSRDYYPFPYAVGSRVDSESWGTDVTSYDNMCREVDIFTYVHQDFLTFFAAGNSGGLQQDDTVGSPAVSKNCVAVGAGLTANYNGTVEQSDSVALTPYQLVVTGGIPGSGTDNNTAFQLHSANIGVSTSGLLSAASPLRLVAAQPADACKVLSNAAAAKGAFVLAIRGNCTYTTKASLAQKAGAAGLILVNSNNTGFFNINPDSSSNAQINIPVLGMPRLPAIPIFRSLLAGFPLTGVLKSLTLPSARWESLAFFSSIGPTPDNRYKPDIVAPGTTISAAASLPPGTNSNDCALSVDRGTSMATPIAAGSATLVRQYFTDGWYPTGQPNASAAFAPSASLIKAVLIGMCS